ncbi:MAG: hypothetical protein ABW189_08265 [Rickettsiales bacterium]
MDPQATFVPGTYPSMSVAVPAPQEASARKGKTTKRGNPPPQPQYPPQPYQPPQQQYPQPQQQYPQPQQQHKPRKPQQPYQPQQPQYQQQQYPPPQQPQYPPQQPYQLPQQPQYQQQQPYQPQQQQYPPQQPYQPPQPQYQPPQPQYQPPQPQYQPPQPQYQPPQQMQRSGNADDLSAQLSGMTITAPPQRQEKVYERNSLEKWLNSISQKLGVTNVTLKQLKETLSLLVELGKALPQQMDGQNMLWIANLLATVCAAMETCYANAIKDEELTASRRSIFWQAKRLSGDTFYLDDACVPIDTSAYVKQLKRVTPKPDFAQSLKTAFYWVLPCVCAVSGKSYDNAQLNAAKALFCACLESTQILYSISQLEQRSQQSEPQYALFPSAPPAETVEEGINFEEWGPPSQEDDDEWDDNPNNYGPPSASAPSAPKPLPDQTKLFFRDETAFSGFPALQKPVSPKPAAFIPLSQATQVTVIPAKPQTITITSPAAILPLDDALLCISNVYKGVIAWSKLDNGYSMNVPAVTGSAETLEALGAKAIKALETKDVSAFKNMTLETLTYSVYLMMADHLYQVSKRTTTEAASVEDAFAMAAKIVNCYFIFERVKSALLSWNPEIKNAPSAA